MTSKSVHLEAQLNAVRAALGRGDAIPYLGAGMLDLVPGGSPVPAAPEALVAQLTKKAAVPHKIRNRLSAAAQYIENFKHRKTVVSLMNQAYAASVAPSPLHLYLAGMAKLPMIVDVWYDDAMQGALAGRSDWGQVQGLSQSEHFGTWFGCYDPAGQSTGHDAMEAWSTLLYKPLGGRAPAANYLVSDSDYVEVLTEIDIQTPIPLRVQALRRDRSFLFLGCRFNDQLQRTFARQIMKRSSAKHWAVLPGEPTRNEERFLTEQNIELIDVGLPAFEAAMCECDLRAAA
jgi:hypothetical protein